MVYSLNQEKSPILYHNQCYLESVSCELSLEGTDVVVDVTPFPVRIEEMIAINIKHANQYVLKQVWVEGTNMFMGKLPVHISNSDTINDRVKHSGEFFIGACSEPNMRWKLVFDLTDIESGQSQTMSVFFQTKRS
ncbi:hypothetical protein [Aliiglaciecola litoralis]|uniref:hypothetical protein n=1 Tax=Aliiglaciecola litoralis TaxID=582857 RepID=UPI0031D5FDAE